MRALISWPYLTEINSLKLEGFDVSYGTLINYTEIDNLSAPGAV